MEKVTTCFEGLFTYSNTSYSDDRGNLTETLNQEVLEWLPRDTSFCHEITSFSKKNSLRGLHYQLKKPQGKLLTVLRGKVFDVALDCRKNSKTFGKYYSCILSESNATSIFIPPGFAHGFQALAKENYVTYSCTKYRHSKSEIAIKFNDEDLGIKWPSRKIIISQKDQKAISFNEFKKIILK